MFSKAKDKNSNDAKPAAAVDAKPSQSASPSMNSSKRSSAPKSMGVPSIISADVVMHGNINASGEVQFDGSMEGDIKAANLIVGEKASVKGEIMCERVTVRGKVEGGIRAKQVSLASTAHILGDIVHSQLSVETGAHFEGACRHSDDPLSEAASTDYRKQRPSPPPSAARPAPPAEPTAVSSNADGDTQAPNGVASSSDTPSFLSPNRSPLR